MGLGKWIEQKCGVIILCKHIIVIREAVLQNRIFIYMVTSCGVQIHLFDHGKIRIIRGCQLSCSLNGIQHAVLAFGPRGFASVHEKAEIRGVGAETNVVGKGRIFRISVKGRKV